MVVGDSFGVATVDIPVGQSGELAMSEVHRLPKVPGTAFGQGVKLYWDSVNKRLTTVATDNTLVGTCWAAAASADVEAEIKLNCVN